MKAGKGAVQTSLWLYDNSVTPSNGRWLCGGASKDRVLHHVNCLYCYSNSAVNVVSSVLMLLCGPTRGASSNTIQQGYY